MPRVLKLSLISLVMASLLMPLAVAAVEALRIHHELQALPAAHAMIGIASGVGRGEVCGVYLALFVLSFIASERLLRRG